MNKAVPNRMYFNTDALPQRDRFPVFCEEIIRRFTGLDLNTQDQSRFFAALEGGHAGAINIAYVTNASLNTARTSKLVRDGNDGLCLMLLEHGVAHYHTARDGSQKLGPGDAVLCDYGYPGEYNFLADARSWGIKIPRCKISSLLPKATRLGGARLYKDPIARKLLFEYLHAARSLDLSSSDRAGALFDDHVVDLIALALGADGEARKVAEERGARHARREAILREINRRSHEQTLSAVAMALKLGITPRYVHLLLEETGKSFSHHLLERRLETAAALLHDPRTQNLKIADIALKAGFNDLSYFNRVFRRYYGMTPRDAREGMPGRGLEPRPVINGVRAIGSKSSPPQIG